MPALPLGRSSPQPGVQASHPTRQETESPPLALRGLALPEGRGTEEARRSDPRTITDPAEIGDRHLWGACSFSEQGT